MLIDIHVGEGGNRLQLEDIDNYVLHTLMLSRALSLTLFTFALLCICVLSATSNRSSQLTFPVAHSLSLSLPSCFALLLHAIFVVVYCFLLSFPHNQ